MSGQNMSDNEASFRDHESHGRGPRNKNQTKKPLPDDLNGQKDQKMPQKMQELQAMG